ncbi:hypothetical protein [Tritonibacter mobilis]|uniref:hypothetical protein n=1 Tax=Tritonibacter mobilis TaxID=379347 RepID=UPI003A5BB1B6
MRCFALGFAQSDPRRAGTPARRLAQWERAHLDAGRDGREFIQQEDAGARAGRGRAGATGRIA